MDEHNHRLIANVHPPDWQNPTASGRYNLVVIGAGTAGLIGALGSEGLGGKVALIERDVLGGDCRTGLCAAKERTVRRARHYAKRQKKV